MTINSLHQNYSNTSAQVMDRPAWLETSEINGITTQQAPMAKSNQSQNCMRSAMQNLKRNAAYLGLGSLAVALGSIFGGPAGAVGAFIITALAIMAHQYFTNRATNNNSSYTHTGASHPSL